MTTNYADSVAAEKPIVIIGAGGHGREVSEILRYQSQHQGGLTVLGFVDDNPDRYQEAIHDLPVLGDWSWFDRIDRNDVAVICGVGPPRVRKQLVERAISSGLSFARVVSKLAYVSPNATIGEGVMIFPETFVSTNTFIGDHVIINVGSSISHDSRVNRYGTINPGVHVAGGVSIGEGCYLGVGSSVIQSISIGPWSVIGAGAVVTRDLPDNVTAVGVPARVIKIGKVYE